MQKKKKVILKPIVYIYINSTTKEIFELTKEEYNNCKLINKGKWIKK